MQAPQRGPASSHMSAMRVLNCTDLVEILYIRERLVADGFHPMPIPSPSIAVYAGADQSFTIEVPDEEVDETRSLLSELGYAKLLL